MNDGDSTPGPAGLPLRPFALERFYARWEFAVAHNLSASDVEPVSLAELLALADPGSAALWAALRLGYTESAGHPLLREEIARLYERVSAGDVLTVSGAEEGILLSVGALVGPGDHVVVVAPAYQSLHDVARARGADASLVWLEAANGWRLDADRVLDALTPSTRLVVVNFPNNPTGSLPGAAEFQRLCAECAERGIRFFSDEVYRGVEPERGTRLPAAADLGEGAISLGVMSKAYGLAGLRIGWIACRDPVVLHRVGALRDYTTICSSAPSEILAIMALRAGDVLIDRAREIVSHNRALLADFFAAHADTVRWVPPRAGTTAFPELIGRDADAFCGRLAAEDGVLLLPGSSFDVPGGHFRVGLGRRGIERGLELLGGRLREV
ncbi:MAG TPA: aminotransferase class I/II-fold pyridoxal phosphate-dependent enzyme [Longimicrobiales bacterium]|nr:aminotransferase class I/II-fold pyridoxal phosphate-dependent enzyme [Longimicrobiales bacterium]